MSGREERDAADEPMAFFSHDSHAAQDVKCQRLLLRCGVAGYGRWWLLCECLAMARGHRIPFETEEDALILSGFLRFGIGSRDGDGNAVDDCKSYVSELIDIGLLKKDENGCIFSSRMQKNALYFGKQRANGRKGGRPKKNSAGDESAGREA